MVDLDDYVFKVYVEAESKNKNLTSRLINTGNLNDIVSSLVKSFSFPRCPDY